MKASIYRITVVLVLLVASTFFVSTASADKIDIEREHEHGTEEDVVNQDESAAQAADIALLVNETSLPVESVEQAIAFQGAFAVYADELITRYPDQISAVWMEPVPNTRGHIQFQAKGRVLVSLFFYEAGEL